MLNQYTQEKFKELEITFEGESKYDKDIVFALYPPDLRRYGAPNGCEDWKEYGRFYSTLMVLDPQGNIKHMKEIPNDNVSYFKKCSDNRYVYILFNRELPKDVGEIKAIIADENLNPIKEVEPIYNFHNRPGVYYNDSKMYCDEHFFKYVDDNHYYVVGTIKTVFEFENDFYTISNDFVQEIINDQVVWQWESVDNLDVMKLSIRHNVFGYDTLGEQYDTKRIQEIVNERGAIYNSVDCMHINSIDVSNDNKVYISLRNVGVIIVDKATNKVEGVISISEDAEIPNPEWEPPVLQHDIHYEQDGSFWCYNNNAMGNDDNLMELREIIYNKALDNPRYHELLSLVSEEKAAVNIYYPDGSFKKIVLNEFGSTRGGNAVRMEEDVYTINYGLAEESRLPVDDREYIQIEEYDFRTNTRNFKITSEHNNYVYMVSRG